MTNELIIQDSNDGFLIVNTLEQALKVAEIVCKSSFCPKDYKDKPGDVLVCMQFGKEVGLKPMQALQNIAVINGRPCIWGDAMLALCLSSPSREYIEETFDELTMTAYCKAKRKGNAENIGKFSQEDAKKAGLWGKQGTWTNYTRRMLQMRARGFALRDTFADVLKGLISAEEASDYPKHEKTANGVTINQLIANKELPKQIESQETISLDEYTQLQDRMVEAQADTIALCQHYKIDSLESLPKALLPKVMAQLEKKIDRLLDIEQMAKGNEVAEFFQQADA